MQRFNLPQMALAKTRRKTMTLQAPASSVAVELGILTALNQLVAAIVREFVAFQLAEVAAQEARPFARARVGDENGANARSVIEAIRQRALGLEAEADQKVRRELSREAERHTGKWKAIVGSAAQIDVSLLIRDDDLVDLISVRSEQASNLIRNLSRDVIDRIERETLTAIFEGAGQEDIAKRIRDVAGLGRNRSRLIARDQASKLNAAMNQYRQEQAGVTHYKWKTILDGRERDTHRRNNGRIFEWANPPPVTRHPGHDINCRCRALAVLIEDVEDLPPSLAAQPEEFAALAQGGSSLETVARTLNQNPFSWERDRVVMRLAHVEQVEAAFRSGASAATEGQLAKIFETFFGIPPSKADLVAMSGRGLIGNVSSNKSLMTGIIKQRLETIREALEMSLRVERGVVVPRNGLREDFPDQPTIPAKNLPADGWSAVDPEEKVRQLSRVETLSSLALKHLDTYSEYGYGIINNLLRKGLVTELKGGKLVPPSPADYEKWKAMIQAMARNIQEVVHRNTLPAQTVLYRGSGTRFIGKLEVGTVFRDGSFVSASRSLKQAETFYDEAKEPVMMVIYAGGRRGLSIERRAAFSYEEEVLLPAGTTFLVREIETGVRRGLIGPRRTYVHVDIVDQPEALDFQRIAQNEPLPEFGKPQTIPGRKVARPDDVAVREARALVLERGGTSVEWGVAHDPKGRELLQWTSGSGGELSLQDVPDLGRRGAGLTIHHNHPRGTSFSAADLQAFDWAPGLDRLYVHTVDGSEFVARRITYDGIGVYVGEARKHLVDEITDALLGGMIAEDAQALQSHWMAQALDKAGHIDYSFQLSARLRSLEAKYADFGEALVSSIARRIA